VFVKAEYLKKPGPGHYRIKAEECKRMSRLRRVDIADVSRMRFGPGLRSPPSSQPEAPGEFDDLDPEAREDHDQIPWPGCEEQRENDREEQRHAGELTEIRPVPHAARGLTHEGREAGSCRLPYRSLRVLYAGVRGSWSPMCVAGTCSACCSESTRGARIRIEIRSPTLSWLGETTVGTPLRQRMKIVRAP